MYRKLTRNGKIEKKGIQPENCAKDIKKEGGKKVQVHVCVRVHACV